MKPSVYRINVAQDSGRKLFGTNETAYVGLFATEIQDQGIAFEVAKELRDRFPAPEFNVSMTYWKCSGSEELF